MKLFNKTNMKNKETRRLPMGKTSKRALSAYAALVLILCCTTTTAFAASDPLTVINNLSEFRLTFQCGFYCSFNYLNGTLIATI